MTVCIAAVCDGGRTIIAACDRLMSASSTSSDSMLKGHRIHPRWLAMTAAEDVGQSEPVLRGVESRLAEKSGTSDEVQSAFAEVYNDELRREAERAVLGRFGLTMAQFRAGPSASLDRELYWQFKHAIEEVKLGCEFLVGGFGPAASDQAQIFQVSSSLPGIIRHRERVGFWAIGSGAEAAISSLGFHNYGPNTGQGLSIYLACEAKFMAESASGVGSKTWLFVLGATGEFFQVGEKIIQELKTWWKEKGASRIPAGTEARVAKLLKPKKTIQ